jgi:2-iminobutanoate/2-iminopropanoate deaminase
MTRSAVSTPKAPALGPYSVAVRANGFVYLSGQTPMDPSTGKLAEGGIDGQTRQCFANLKAVLEAAGLGLGDVVKVNVYLADMADFAAMNAIYETQFAPPHPARTTIGVAALPFGARVEIEMVAAERNAR